MGAAVDPGVRPGAEGRSSSSRQGGATADRATVAARELREATAPRREGGHKRDPRAEAKHGAPPHAEASSPVHAPPHPVGSVIPGTNAEVMCAAAVHDDFLRQVRSRGGRCCGHPAHTMVPPRSVCGCAWATLHRTFSGSWTGGSPRYPRPCASPGRPEAASSRDRRRRRRGYRPPPPPSRPAPRVYWRRSWMAPRSCWSRCSGDSPRSSSSGA